MQATQGNHESVIEAESKGNQIFHIPIDIKDTHTCTPETLIPSYW